VINEVTELLDALHDGRLTPEEVALMWKTAPPRMPFRTSDKTRVFIYWH